SSATRTSSSPASSRRNVSIDDGGWMMADGFAPPSSIGHPPSPMNVTVKIQRYDPDRDEAPHWEEYHLTDVDPMDRALDLLHHIKWHLDGSLTFRKSCAHGICGSDAMKINGENKLACSVLVQDLVGKGGGTIT